MKTMTDNQIMFVTVVAVCVTVISTCVSISSPNYYYEWFYYNYDESINFEKFLQGPPPSKLFLDYNVSNNNHSDRYAKIYFHEQQMKRQVITNDRIGKHFFQRNWEPSYSCVVQVRMGPQGDGGKWICDPHRFLAGPDCTVYSVGSNGDFGFEQAVYTFNPACAIHTFDPMKPPPDKPDFVHFHSWGIGPQNAGSTFTIETVMRHLGHKNISVFKIDCEGCEILSLLHFPRGSIKQIAVEVHYKDGRAYRIHRFFQSLMSAGFAIFSKEPNIEYSDGNAVEYSLVLLK